MFEKIKNPNAKPANIALALLYIVVITALFVGALKYRENCIESQESQTEQTSNL